MDLSLSRRMAISLSTDRHYWVDRLDPWAVHFTGSFGIRWYGLAYLAGILAAYLMFVSWARRRRLPIAPGDAGALVYCAGFGVFAGDGLVTPSFTTFPRFFGTRRRSSRYGMEAWGVMAGLWG